MTIWKLVGHWGFCSDEQLFTSLELIAETMDRYAKKNNVELVRRDFLGWVDS